MGTTDNAKLCEPTSIDELTKLCQEKSIENLNLSKFEFESPIDFSNKKLRRVIFPCKGTLRGMNFNNAELIDCSFNGATLNTCAFRYAVINNSSFKGTHFENVDFYSAEFKGSTFFYGAKIKNSNLYCVTFETYCITKNNLERRCFHEGFLIQENKSEFKNFLSDSTIERLDAFGEKWKKQKYSLDVCYKEAERIYRQLSSLWESKGHNHDARWAYMKSQEMRRRHFWSEISTDDEIKRFRKLKAACLWLKHVPLGYGAKLGNVIVTFLVITLLFSVIYWCQLGDLGEGLKASFYNMLDIDHDIAKKNKIIHGIQSAISVFLTGFIGFVVADKIRRS